MFRLTSFVLAHRALVVVVWLLIAVAGGATAPHTVDALSYDFGLPGQAAYETNTEIHDLFNSGGVDDPLVLTAASPDGALATPAGQKRFSEAATAIASAAPGTRVVTPANSEPKSLVSSDGTRAVALLYPRIVPGPESYAAALPGIEAAAKEARFDGQPWQLTSSVLLAEDSSSDRGILVEIILGGAGALIVLALVFASLLAGLPLLVAAVSILATFLALLGLTTLTEVSFVVQYLVALIGLGVAIDYSLLIVMRWREERARGAGNDTAVRSAMATAGRSVVFSGVTVAVSLAALIAVPLPFLRSIGLGGLLIPLLSVATSLTLVPVVLQTIGPRLLWPRRAAADPTSRRRPHEQTLGIARAPGRSPAMVGHRRHDHRAARYGHAATRPAARVTHDRHVRRPVPSRCCFGSDHEGGADPESPQADPGHRSHRSRGGGPAASGRGRRCRDRDEDRLPGMDRGRHRTDRGVLR